MNLRKLFTSTRQRWLRKPLCSHAYQPWLLEESSLTARLRQQYADFYVSLIKVHNQKPTAEEAALLHVDRRTYAQTREVLLHGDNRPVVFAHSILPRQSLSGEWRGLGHLGNRPLGEVLFANPKIKRIPLSYKKLAPHHALYQAAKPYTSGTPAYLWARRSVFSLNCASIMVVEVFLPPLVAHHTG